MSAASGEARGGIDGQYDFVRATFDDAAGRQCSAHSAASGRRRRFYRDVNWFARVGFLHAFDQDKIGDNETPTKGYTLLNADLAYTLQAPAAGPVRSPR